jgi:competence protein ComEA
MPTRPGHADPTEVEVASRLSALGLPVPPATGRPVVDSPGGWLPDQPSVAPPLVVRRGVMPRVPATAAAPPMTSLLRAWVEDRLPLWAHGMTDRAKRRAGFGVAAVIVLVIAGALLVKHHHSGTAAYAGSSWPGSTTTSVAGGTPASPESVDGDAAVPASGSESIVVDVGGKVRHPGLVTLPPGSRVADAIAAAGGALRRRDIATTDLAARVGDGQLLLIGTTGSGAATGPAASGDPTSSAGSQPAPPVDLSSADLTTLETLPGVGPVTAQKIIDWRTAHNGFTSIEQLQQVPGIGPAHYAEVESLVTP